MKLKDVRIYQKANGKAPFSDWLSAMKDGQARRAVIRRVQRLSLGNPGDVKVLGDGVSELRIDTGPGYRIYFAEEGREIILLLCGGDKQKQQNDIETAKAYWQDHRSDSDA